MSEQDFASLEAQLRARIASHSLPQLRDSVLRLLAGAQRRERDVNLGASVVAGITIVIGLALAAPWDGAVFDEASDGRALDPVALTRGLGLDAQERQRAQILFASARVPRIAPPVGSLALDLGQGR